MNNLDLNEILLLDNLIYLKDLDPTLPVGRNVYKLLHGQLKDSIDLKSGEYPCEMSKSDWEKVLTDIQNDPRLTSLMITNSVVENSGFRAACFVDNSSGAVTAVFRGTASYTDWYDDVMGDCEADTQQQRALKYINDLPANYQNITVSGHSKGGNEAQYVTVLSNRVGKCVSFDGQGFSKEFIQTHANQISMNESKITSISSARDFVNILMTPIAGHIIYIDAPLEANPMRYHCPNAVFGSNGKLNREVDQSPAMQMANNVSANLLSVFQKVK